MPKARLPILFLFTLLRCSFLGAQTTDALIRQGNRYYNKQDYDQSLTDYEKALKKTPGNPDAHFNLGFAYLNNRQPAEAAAQFSEELKLSPNETKAHYRLAQAYRKTGETEKAQKEIELYQQLSQQSAQKVESERAEIQQFVFALKHQ